MKSGNRMYLPLLLLLLYSSSCKKIPDPPVEDIVGEWVWVFTYPSRPYIVSNRLTPQNTGIQETFIYNSDLTWLKIQNDLLVDSGTYSIGKGSFRAPGDSFTFHYDSIVFYREGIKIEGMEEYYRINLDTLDFGKFIHDQIDDPDVTRSWKCYARKSKATMAVR